MSVLLQIMAVIQIQGVSGRGEARYEIVYCVVYSSKQATSRNGTNDAGPALPHKQSPTSPLRTDKLETGPLKPTTLRRESRSIEAMAGFCTTGRWGCRHEGSTMLLHAAPCFSGDTHTSPRRSVQSRAELRPVESRNRPTHSKSGEPSSGSCRLCLFAAVADDHCGLALRSTEKRYCGGETRAVTHPKLRPPSQASTSRLRGRCTLFNFLLR
jgi:hypothetical protein